MKKFKNNIQLQQHQTEKGVTVSAQDDIDTLGTQDILRERIKAIEKKQVYVLTVNNMEPQQTEEVKNSCPVKIIKIV